MNLMFLNILRILKNKNFLLKFLLLNILFINFCVLNVIQLLSANTLTQKSVSKSSFTSSSSSLSFTKKLSKSNSFGELNLDELLEPSLKLTSKEDQKLATIQYYSILKTKQIRLCQTLINKYQPLYKTLFSKLTSKEQSLLINEYSALLTSSPQDCHIPQKLTSLIRSIQNIIAYSNPNVVFILSLTSSSSSSSQPQQLSNTDLGTALSISDLEQTLSSQVLQYTQELSQQFHHSDLLSKNFISFNIIEGIKSYFKEQNYTYTNVYFLNHTASTDPAILIAKSVFIYKASVIVVASTLWDSASFRSFVYWADNLKLTTIFLSNISNFSQTLSTMSHNHDKLQSQNVSHSPAQDKFSSNVEMFSDAKSLNHNTSTLLRSYSAEDLATPYVLSVYPNPYLMSQVLSQYFKTKNFSKIAFLIPYHKKDDNLINIILRTLAQNNIQIIRTLFYESQNYESMKTQAQELFGINYELRRDEYLDLIEKRRQQAQEQNEPFNPKFVDLPPIIDFDALFIADNFIAVKQWIKIFKYFNVPPIPLVGTYEWRSKDLVDPYDSFLAHSVFIDFIGPYQLLPSQVKSSLAIKDEDIFIDLDTMQKLDYHLIGYYAAKLVYPLLIFEQKQKIKKSLVPVLLKTQKLFPQAPLLSLSRYSVNSDSNMFFDFTSDGKSRWPVYIFKPSFKSLSLIYYAK